MERLLRTIRSSLLLTVILCLCIPWSGTADVVELTGTIDRVPGHAGEKLGFRVGAVKTSAKTVHFWLKLKNDGDTTIDVVVCAMLSLKSGSVMHENFLVEKVDGKWACEADGQLSGLLPDVHFGCSRVSVPPGRIRDAFDQFASFTQDFEPSELGVVYFDLLKDCPLEDCGQVFGPDHFLIPRAPSNHSDWTNIWAGHSPYAELTDSGLSESEWPSGNWVTMGNPMMYSARFTGLITGAPAGSIISLELDDTVQFTRFVEPDPENPPCGGIDIEVDELFTIPDDPNASSRFTLQAAPPPIGARHTDLSGGLVNCNQVDEDSIVRLNASVFAEVGAPFYSPGDFMYGVRTVLVRDTVAPTIKALSVEKTGRRSLQILVEATDETSIPVGATFVYSTGGPETELPIGYGDPSTIGDRFFFADSFSNLPLGVPITYRVKVFDDIGNVAISDPQALPFFADCNDNGVDDALDIANGTSEDLNSNGIPDECEISTVAWRLSGVAQGGDITLTVDGFGGMCTITIPTLPGESAADVVANLAAAINSDPCFLAEGLTATASRTTLYLRGFELDIDDIGEVLTDPGLGHSIEPTSIPTLDSFGLLALFCLTAGLGWYLLRHRRDTGSPPM